MGEVVLFEHNEIGYGKLCDSLNDNKCSTINHATGTGKSFIALKYLYENRNKKCLYISPTYPIIEQLMDDCYKIGITPEDLNVETMIYRTLLEMDMSELYKKYDVIIFDEYHRTGAKETYKKIKQLKLQLNENNDDKKFIGLTATPVRYLDKERNMTEEIFDGVVASNISLAQAMLEGLLPVPMYINSKISCETEFEKTRRRVDRLAPGEYKNQMLEELGKTSLKIDDGESNVKDMINQYIDTKKGKYIIFCSSIDELQQYSRQVDGWFSDIGKVSKYTVHSAQSRKNNQKNLDNFNEEKDGLSVLLCIDILNEGVHVDGIDGIFMLRRTTSPIIYFQQIGRALSFSGRNKQIKIFDLRNNFGNHNAIDLVYQEVQEEMKKCIELYPEKKEFYEEKLRKFTIMDETKQILKELNELNSELTNEKIINSKLEYAIKVLSKRISQGEISSLAFADNEVKEAYNIISKYSDYVNNNQFEKLLDLDILLPEKLAMTLEERQQLLEGYDSIYEKQQKIQSVTIDKIIDFVLNNRRNVDINSENAEEKNMAQKYLYYLPNLDNDLKQKLKEVLKNNNVKFNSYEKVLLDEKINKNDLQELIKLANGYINENQILPQYLSDSIEEVTIKYTTKELEELFKILKINEDIIKQKREEHEKERHEKINDVLKYFEENIDLSHDKLDDKDVLDKMKKMSLHDKSYIQRRYVAMKKNYYKTMVNSSEKNEMTVFCRKMNGIDEEKITEYESQIERDKEAYTTLSAVVDFMCKHDGNLPSVDSDDEVERKIAIKYNECLENNQIDKKIETLNEELGNSWYDANKLIYEIVIETFKEKQIKLIILKNIEFLNKNGRRPLKNSNDEEEIKLATEYQEKCIPNLGEEKINVLNRIFNSKKNLRKTCTEYINNIKMKSKEDKVI